MSTWQPYYRRYRPADKLNISGVKPRNFADFALVYKPPAGGGGDLALDNDGRDARARAILAARGNLVPPTPGTPPPPPTPTDVTSAPGKYKPADLTAPKKYSTSTTTTQLADTACLALMAYMDYFKADPSVISNFKDLVSNAIMLSQPGWCGTYGPDMNQGSVLVPGFLYGDKTEGNYDMRQMYLAAIAYAYYDQLTAPAQTKLIEDLLGNAIIARFNLDPIPPLDPIRTRGPLPDDWDLAGYFKCFLTPPFYAPTPPYAGSLAPGIPVKDNGETENHILTMLAARYLTNQLLFQRTRDERYDNRRNGVDGAPSCTQLALQLFRNILSDDFSEYNAKTYQEETRTALLTLSSYAYDDEVRLAARMVLDYVSAKFAVSSSDLRRLLPFRRRNEDPNNRHDDAGFMRCGLLFDIPYGGHQGQDPMVPWFALQTGNIRACQVSAIAQKDGTIVLVPLIDNTVTGIPASLDLTLEVVSDYRVPDPILDLIVNNPSRRFFQRLHRRIVDNDAPGQKGGNRTADNIEIYAGSPSYLITAGSQATDYAIDPRLSGTALGLITGAVGGEVSAAVAEEILGAAFGPAGVFFSDLLGLVTGYVSGAVVGAAIGAMFAKGSPALGDVDQQLGVAVTTSFMPAAGNKALEAVLKGYPDSADRLLIQFGHFSQHKLPAKEGDGEANYGVAPDFACGWVSHLPDWLTTRTGPPGPGELQNWLSEPDADGWSFADFSSPQGPVPLPGFFLALLRRQEQYSKGTLGDLAVLEVFDTLADSTDPPLTFPQFKTGVRGRNPSVVLKSNVPGTYTTTNLNQISFVIYPPGAIAGAQVRSVKYADPTSPWARGDAATDGGGLVNGTVLNSVGDAVITIDNPMLNKQIRLDLSDMWNPRRTDENGVVEEAGNSHDVWTDFDWKGTQEGDVYRPFALLAPAEAKVADHGTIRMIPSKTKERNPIGVGKRFTLIAPIGEVTIGVK